MGVRIGDKGVKFVLSDYYGETVEVICNPPNAQQYEKYQKATYKVKGRRVITSATAAHSAVASLIVNLTGIDILGADGEWRSIAEVGDAERRYLIDKHPVLLGWLAGKLFRVDEFEFDDDEEGAASDDDVPLASSAPTSYPTSPES